MRICLITQEYPGIGRSGGIGQYAYSLSEILSVEHEVTILYCGESNQSRMPKKNNYVDFIYLTDLSKRKYSGGINSYYGRSLQIYDWLRNEDFDVVNFPDFQGLAIATIQGKKSGTFAYEPLISVTAHGPNRWALESNQVNFNLQLNAEMEFFEKFSIENCDYLFTPSIFIRNWIKKQNWKVPEKTINLQNPLKMAANNQNVDLKVKDSKKTICFFGRLEPRKGFNDFLQASEPYLEDAEFILVGGESPGHDCFSGFPTDSNVRKIRKISDMGSFEAQNFFSKKDALVVIPSKSENCPYAVIETVVFGNQILARRIGGIPELIPESAMFDTVSDMSKIFSRVINEEKYRLQVDLILSNEEAIRNYLELFRVIEKNLSTQITKKRTSNSQTIGVVVAHYNQSKYLEAALFSVQQQTFSEFECIVIDDGSNKNELVTFKEIVKKFETDCRFRFITKENEDVGATRNFGVSKLKSDLVTFLDADDTMDQNCLLYYSESFSRGADIVTSHFNIFEGEQNILGMNEISVGSYEPFGGCVEVLWFKNVVGGANFATKKSTFEQLGKFNEQRNSNHQDWQILTRAALNGKIINIVPERLLNYRVVSNSMSRTRSHSEGQLSVISEYNNQRGFNGNELLTQLMIENISMENYQSVKPMTYLLAERIRISVERVFPLGSFRWRIVAKVAAKILK
jgi:glycosyltransferase involved in cell wall biosynthesis